MRGITKAHIIIFIILALAVAPAVVLGAGNRNLLLIGVMGFMPLVLMFTRQWYPLDVWLLAFMVSIIIAPLLNHPESMRWSTVLYSCMFCITFMAYNRLLHLSTSFTPYVYLKLLKNLIYSYAIVLIIQQFCVLFDLPIFNVSNYNPEEPWKLNALAAEPSHSARIVGLLMYCYISVKELVQQSPYRFGQNFKQDKWLWLAFLWTMLTMGSGTAFVFLPIVFFKVLKRQNLRYAVLVIVLGIFVLDVFDITVYSRTLKTVTAFWTLDEQAILEADHSAAMRIVPFFILIKMLTINSLDGWLGHGVDYVASFMYLKLPGVYKGTSGGGLLQLWMEYGFISFMLFIIFSLKATISRLNLLDIIIWVLLIFMYGVNNQIVWLCVVLMFTKQYYEKQFSLDKNGNT